MNYIINKRQDYDINLLIMTDVFFWKIILADDNGAILKKNKITAKPTTPQTGWQHLPIELKYEILKESIKQADGLCIIGTLAKVSKEFNGIIKSNVMNALILEKANDVITKSAEKYNRERRYGEKVFAWSFYSYAFKEEIAIKEGIIPWLKDYFEKNPDVLCTGFPYSPLHVAAATDSLHATKFICENFKDTCKLDRPNKDDHTPLHIAVCYKSHKVAPFLLVKQFLSRKHCNENKEQLLKRATSNKDERMVGLIKYYF